MTKEKKEEKKVQEIFVSFNFFKYQQLQFILKRPITAAAVRDECKHMGSRGKRYPGINTRSRTSRTHTASSTQQTKEQT